MAVEAIKKRMEVVAAAGNNATLFLLLFINIIVFYELQRKPYIETNFISIFRVDYQPQLGRYDLRIKNATYERDNGNFECRKVEFGTGNKLHSSTVQLVVLLPPSPPVLAPVQPTVTEGKEFNLTCSSVGGSPPPEIIWYKDGKEQSLEALYIPGRNRSEATSSILSEVPKKDDDGSSYKCTVWNRAIDRTGLMEASTNINVNCE